MAKPVAFFGFSIQGLIATFINNSLNSPTSYQWDFGDGNNSILKNPSNTYAEAGYYTVTLIATNADGDSEPFTIEIGLGTAGPVMNTPIIVMIDHNLPTALVGEATNSEKATLIHKWQLYLEPLVDEVLPADTHNEFGWPPLFNVLIAQLASYDIILQGANQFLSLAGNLGGSSSSSGSGGEDGTVQQIKSIETGPAKTEWYENNNKTTESEIINNIGEAFSSAVKAGGALDQLKASICQLAHRVRINLPQICEALPFNTSTFVIAKTTPNKYCTDPYAEGL